VAKPKAERWLTDAFAEGVDEQHEIERRRMTFAYPGALLDCWLSHFDPAQRPCSPGPLERFHFVRRQDVEARIWQQLTGATWRLPGLYPAEYPKGRRDELILLAAWDSRNGGYACEQHHRRYDRHQVSLPSEQIVVPYEKLPGRVVAFGFDWSEGALLERFPSLI